jgi:hypothetical protein
MSSIQGVNAYPVTAPPKAPVVRSEAKETAQAERIEVAQEAGERPQAAPTNPNLGNKFSATA